MDQIATISRSRGLRQALGCGLAGAWFSLAMPHAQAATVTAVVTDEAGYPLADAVVTIAPAAGTPMPPPASQPDTATIDQRNETFVPSVVTIRTGGSVVFHNDDAIRHHVYSFAPIRPFELLQNPGERSQPVVFDKPGSAAIGCNIHDHMTAYVHVTDAPWAKVTDPAGKAVLTGIGVGRYVATVWHPRLRPKTVAPSKVFTLESTDSTLTVALAVLPPRRPAPRDY